MSACSFEKRSHPEPPALLSSSYVFYVGRVPCRGRAATKRRSVPTHERIRSLLQHYGVALFAVGAALVSTLLLQGFFPYPFLFLFFGAVMASAWFGGPGPGLCAVLLSVVVVDYFFVPPFHSFSVSASAGAY